ncbi:hypothetical protein RHMOL_Rhmol04G0007700 [Rhododendron molle]|uniref:Uncharacterized protein n=1 Tax=Rhododendron molle TaxID=49168 RepID=A0ACC0NXZ4_RHOML|nr:hypothetical protein RHMOL_Rhmol04G0007700 [Rhododendron molle]
MSISTFHNDSHTDRNPTLTVPIGNPQGCGDRGCYEIVQIVDSVFVAVFIIVIEFGRLTSIIGRRATSSSSEGDGIDGGFPVGVSVFLLFAVAAKSLLHRRGCSVQGHGCERRGRGCGGR